MKVAILEIAPELAVEAFAILRDEGVIMLGSVAAQPGLRVVVSHPALPEACEGGARKAIPIVRMTVRVDESAGARRHRIEGFYIDPWAVPLKPSQIAG